MLKEDLHIATPPPHPSEPPVGNPDRKYLWFLSRKPQIDQQTRDELLSKAQQQGYDTTRLIWRTPDADMPKGKK